LQLAESAEAKSNTFTPETHLRHRHLTTTGPFEVLENLATVAEAHDDPSGDHPRRVGELSFHLAKRLDLSPEACDQIRKAAPLHDVGKVGIPAEILSKVEPLSPEEVEIVRRHTRVGAELLQSTGEIELGTAIEVALHHHEWWDGSGYPLGLAGNSIPIAARIAAIAECFDAMTHDRVYRPKLSPYRALELIRERAGRQFDPLLVDKFHEVIGEQLGNGSDIDAFLLRDSGNQTSTFVRAKRRLLGRLKDSLPSQTRELHLL
jgi:putative two-component system response regulator